MGAEEDALKAREQGLARTGSVFLRNFDQGIIETLGAFVAKDNNGLPKYYLKIDTGPGNETSCGPPGLPGVPVVFANPEDVIQNVQYPFILVRRDDISPANERWHTAAQQYRAPGLGALQYTVTGPGGVTRTGFDRYEQVPQAKPFDLTYTIQIKARYRGAPGQRNQANTLFRHALRIFPSYGKVNVIDSIGDLRGYEAFNEGISQIDSVGEIQEREAGYSMTIRVEAELDINDPQTVTTVRSLTPRVSRR